MLTLMALMGVAATPAITARPTARVAIATARATIARPALLRAGRLLATAEHVRPRVRPCPDDAPPGCRQIVYDFS